MPIVDPFNHPQIQGQIADLCGQIGAVKGWTKTVFRVAGVTVTSFADENELRYDDKMLAVDSAISKVVALGIVLPISIKVYCTGSTNIGRLQMKNVAFQRGVSGARDASIVLSPKVLNYEWASALNGLCTQPDIYDQTPKGLCTAIVVHELGHLLHEIQDEDLFWGRMPEFPNGLKPLDIFRCVSAYAASNPKELVAEVFLGRVFGKNFEPFIIEAYRALGGPAQNVLA